MIAPLTLIVFAHGKESGPKGSKIQRLAKVGRSMGAQVLSIDYAGIDDPEQRVANLLAYELPEHSQLILVGSSMGGYVSTVASSKLSQTGLRLKGLFLLAPAFYMSDLRKNSGYQVYEPIPDAELVEIVHGWNDEVVPAAHAVRFAQKNKANLHLLDSDHRLTSALDQIEVLFADFLRRVMTV
jgi:pimeloyl-ACP methyl ester carboxylesterase